MLRQGDGFNIIACIYLICSSSRLVFATTNDDQQQTIIVVYDKELVRDGRIVTSSENLYDAEPSPSTADNFTFIQYTHDASFDSIIQILQTIAKIHHHQHHHHKIQKQHPLLLFSFTPYNNFLMKNLKSMDNSGCFSVDDGGGSHTSCNNNNVNRFEIETYDFGSSVYDLVSLVNFCFVFSYLYAKFVFFFVKKIFALKFWSISLYT